MKAIYVFFIIVLLTQNLVKGQTKDSTKTNVEISKSELVPLEAEDPEITKKEHVINSNDFVINLISKKILIKYKNKTIGFDNIENFNKYLEENKISKTNAEFYLEIGNKTDRKKTLEIFKILELNDIRNFNLITKK
ncbi:hypothetical protein AR687_09125 [Flavobacteriaceae bacterium CRH]|nr:hypothetical protein AR687_09125 [Flavobacteriaceae bacterium CRH]